MMNTPIFNQADPKWADKKLLPTNLTMRRWGCYITSLSSMLHNFAKELDPGQVLDKLIEVNGISTDGLLTYDGVMRAFPDLYFNTRAYTSNDPSAHLQKMPVDVALDRVARLLYLGQPTILCVDNLYNDRIPDHAILATDTKRNLGKITDFRVMDPDGGHDRWFSEKYGPLRENLYGYVSIIGPPVWFPEDSDPKAGSALWKAAEIKQGHSVETYAREILDTLL